MRAIEDTASKKSTLALLAGLLAAPVLVFSWLPWAPVCVSQSLLDLPCPGCGLGRALEALQRLDVFEALVCYPPLLPLSLVYLALLGGGALRLSGRRLRFEAALHAALGISTALAVAGNWTLALTSTIHTLSS